MGMNRREFLGRSFVATAAGLLIPEWLLDPPKGRSMVAVVSPAESGVVFLSPFGNFVQVLPGPRRVHFHRGSASVSDPVTLRLMRERLRQNKMREYPESSWNGQPFIEFGR